MSKRPEQTARTRAELLQAFWQLYAAAPMERITVSQVCQRAGYNRGTFYLYFKDLYELRDCVEEELLEGMTDCVESCMKCLDKDNSKAAKLLALKDVVLYYERNKERIMVLLGTRGDPGFVLRLKDRLKPLWRTYVIADNVADHTEQEIDLMLEYALSGGLFMISKWLADPGDISSAEMGRLVYDTAIKDVSERAAS